VLRKRAVQQVVGIPLVDFPDVTASTEPSSGEPTVLTGALIGYARDSAKDQILDRQTAALEAAGCIRIFADKQSGGNADREELRKALDYLRPGDTLVVPSLGRLGRSLQDMISIVAGCASAASGSASRWHPSPPHSRPQP
jgi:resolvase-like protein